MSPAVSEEDYFRDFLPSNPGAIVKNLEDTKFYFGWAVGAGIETAFTDKIEYLCSDLGSKEYDAEFFGIDYSADIDLNSSIETTSSRNMRGNGAARED